MIFYGNELTYGVVVSGWLFGVGLGAFIGRKLTTDLLFLAFLSLSIILPLSVFVLRLLPGLFGYGPGEIIGILPLLGETFILLLPIYLIFGLIFSLGLKKFSYHIGGGIKGFTRPYIVDSIGDLFGGIAFSYIFIVFFSPMRNLFIVSALAMVPVIFLKGKRFVPLMLFFVVLFFLPITEKCMNFGYNNRYRGFEIKEHWETRYGRYMEIEKAGERSLLCNGIIATTYPTYTLSEKIHIPLLLSRGKKEDILYLGFPDPGIIRELIKYHSCTVVDPDPLAEYFLREHLEKEFSEKVNFVRSDPRMFVRRTKKSFDAVFLAVGDPLNLSINRFYSLSFVEELKKIVGEDGVISLEISSGEDYLNRTVLDYNSLVYWTYKEGFDYSILIPGYNLWLIFSNAPLSIDSNAMQQELNRMNLEYLDLYTIQAFLLEERREKVKEQLNANFIGFNTDTWPRAFLLSMILWTEKHSNLSWIFKWLIHPPWYILFFLVPAFLIRKTGFRVGLIGAMAIGVGYLCILSLQIIYGNLYHLVGLITGLFMFGVGLGTYLTERLGPEPKLKLPFLWMGFLYFMLLLIVRIRTPSLPIFFLIPTINLMAGAVIGWVYPVATMTLRKDHRDEITAPLIYTYDVIGGAVGALLLTLFFFPIFGITSTILLFIGLNILAYMTQ
ncbi:hypothetical protein KAW18_15695 [candidate division WOR-3 bacterium]|nr:hypothetical protein [candidate division WOR-3 bacterium]